MTAIPGITDNYDKKKLVRHLRRICLCCHHTIIERLEYGEVIQPQSEHTAAPDRDWAG